MPTGRGGGLPMRCTRCWLAGWLAVMVLLLSACETAGPTSSTSASSAAQQESTAATGSPATAESADLETLAPPPTDSSLLVRDLPTEMGTISYSLPTNASPDPLVPPPLPNFALAIEQWIVPDCCRLIITVQTVEPRFPDREKMSEQEVNGVVWRTYDIGPEDGSQLTAFASEGSLSVLVSTQTSYGDGTLAPVATAVINDLIQTVTFTEAG